MPNNEIRGELTGSNAGSEAFDGVGGGAFASAMPLFGRGEEKFEHLCDSQWACWVETGFGESGHSIYLRIYNTQLAGYSVDLARVTEMCRIAASTPPDGIIIRPTMARLELVMNERS